MMILIIVNVMLISEGMHFCVIFSKIILDLWKWLGVPRVPLLCQVVWG